MRRAAGIICATIGLSIAAGPAAASPEATAAPIIRLDGEEIAACGVAFEAPVNGAQLSAEIVLTKTKLGPVFRLTARYAGQAQLADIALETEYASTAGLMPRARPQADGSLTAQAPLPGMTGAEFMRTLMVSGGRLLVGLAGPAGDVVEVAIKGPLSHEVRGNYLACAGDIERP